MVARVVDVVEVARDVGHHPDPHAVAQVAQDAAGVADDAPVARPSPHLHARSARAGRRDQPASAREIRRHPGARGRRAGGEGTRGRVAGQPGWDDLAGQAGKAAAARELDHAPAIDRVVQRPAHPRVIERALAHVEEEVAGKWRGRRVHVAGVGESKRARLVERQLDGGRAGGDDCVGAAVLHGGHLRRGILGGRDGDRVGEPVRTGLGRPRAKARVAHQPRTACRCERRDPVRPRARRGAPADERRRRPRGKHVGQRCGELVLELGVGPAQVDGDRPCRGVGLDALGEVAPPRAAGVGADDAGVVAAPPAPRGARRARSRRESPRAAPACRRRTAARGAAQTCRCARRRSAAGRSRRDRRPACCRRRPRRDGRR